MANNILSAIIDVKAPNVTATFSKVATATDKTADSLSKLQKQVSAFGGGVRPLTTSLSAASTALTKTVSTSTQATLALSNLGRVAQDAPFGFIGIANNLNPLLESFQRLKVSTGSTGGALKALGASLKGPGGIGFALSVVSSLAIVFGDKLFGLSKAAKEAEEANKKLAESVVTDLSKLTALTGIVQNLSASTEDRRKALAAINQEYAKYLPNLGIEKVTAENISKAYDQITDSLLRQAVVKGLQEQISASVEKTAQAIIKLSTEQEKERLNAEKAKRLESGRPDQFKRSVDALQNYTRATTDGYLATIKSNQVSEEQQSALANTENRIKRLKELLKEELSPLLNLTKNFDDLAINLDKAKVPLEEKKVQVKKLIFEVGEIEITAPEDVKPVATEFATMFQTELKNYFTRTEKIDFSLLEALRPQALTDAEKLAREIGDKFNTALSNALGSGLAAIGEGLGDVISGKGFGSSIINVIGSLLEELGKALISFGIVKSGLDKLLGPGGIAIPGGVAIALGVAAIAFGRIFKNSVGARAVGGPVSKGNPYVVGERGKEVFIPNTAGRIIPNNKIGVASSGMNNIVITGVFKQKGNDLVAVLSNVNRYQSRNS